MMLRIVRPDKLLTAIRGYVLENMGQKYIENPSFDINECYEDSTALTPMIFILSPGADPMSDVLKYANNKNITVINFL